MCSARRPNQSEMPPVTGGRAGRPPRRIVMASALVLLLLAGCRAGKDGQAMIPLMPIAPDPPPTEQDVWNGLSTYLDVHDFIIRSATDRIVALADDNRQRRRAIEWRINNLRLMRSALKKDAPIAALLDAWSLTLQLREYQNRRAEELPTEMQAIVHEASDACVREIEKVALQLLKERRFGEIKEQVYEFSRENPVAGGFSTVAPKALSESRVEIPALKAILAIPLAPFRAVQGIDSTAQAVHEFNKIAIRFADAAEDMPDAMNSQLQLTLLDLKENDVAESLLASTNRVSESSSRFADAAERFAATADALPGRVRTETAGLIDDLSGKQEELRATIQQVESASKSVDAAVQRVRETTPELASAIEKIAIAGQNLTETAHAIRGMVEYFQSLSDKAPASGVPTSRTAVAAESAERPFDVREYGSAAESIATAAREIQVVSEKLRALLDDPALRNRVDDLDQRMAANIDRAAQRADAVASSVMFKGSGLLVGAFVLAIVYRFITRPRQKLA